MPDELATLTALAVARFGRKAEKLGNDEDLFDALGIDSLQALDLMTDIEDAFHVEIPDYELQGVTTLRGLAEVVRRRR